jgi:hypothetical protein
LEPLISKLTPNSRLSWSLLLGIRGWKPKQKSFKINYFHQALSFSRHRIFHRINCTCVSTLGLTPKVLFPMELFSFSIKIEFD